MLILFWGGALMWLGMWKIWDKVAHDRTGGGSDPTPAQVIPAPAAPSVSQTAAESAQAQLQYNPQLVAQDAALQAQYAPQYAQSQYDITAKYTPLYRALLEQQFPQVKTLADQTSQQLSSPTGLSADQQAAQDAIRQRAYDESAQGIRSAANVGGNLYGGRSQLREDRARNELAQGFATQDITLQQQQRQQALSQLAMLFQLAGINVQNPQVSSYGQAPAASGNSLYNALVQNNSNQGIIPGQAGTPSQAGDIISGVGSGALAAKIFFVCLPGTSLIDTPDGSELMADIQAGDSILLPDGTEDVVMMKYEYIAAPTEFTKITFSDGTSVETCDRHIISDQCAGRYAVGDMLQGRVIERVEHTTRSEKTYDLLTKQEDGGYASSGIRIQSMIPAMHKMSAELQEAIQ